MIVLEMKLKGKEEQFRRIDDAIQTAKNKQRQSNNYHQARIKLAKQHLKVSRQRKDFAVKLARCVVLSNDIVAFEDLKIKNLVKNRHLERATLFRLFVRRIPTCGLNLEVPEMFKYIHPRLLSLNGKRLTSY